MADARSRADGHSARAGSALLRLAESDPAFAALSLWCRHRDGRSAPSQDPEPPAWTDGVTIFYGAAFERLDAAEQMGAAAHQILHVAFRHAQRARAMGLRLGERFEEDLFGLAADAVVNETLVLADRPPPRPCPLLSELLMEALEIRSPPEQALADWDVERLYLTLTGEAGAQRAAEREERMARARAYGGRSGYACDLAEAEEAGEKEPGQEDAAWRERVARALEAGRLTGEGLGVVGRRLADLPEPRTPWEVVLRGMVAKAALQGPRLTWRRPTRRWLAREAEARRRGAAEPGYEPGLLWERDTPIVAMAIDASASVSDALLHRFAAEVCGVGRRTGAAVELFVFDVAVRDRRRLSPGLWAQEIARIDFSRGGGTSFVEVVEEAARIDPSILVILTDLDGPIGPRPGRLPVIWATPESRAWFQPPFGTVLSLDR